MKTKRILALILALFMLFGAQAAFSASAADGVDDLITLHKETKPPYPGFYEPGYAFFYVRGVDIGESVHWSITKDGQELAINQRNITGVGFTLGLEYTTGTYEVSLKVKSGGVDVDPSRYGTPVSLEVCVPNRKNLRDALNGDKSVKLGFLYEKDVWTAYTKARNNAVNVYNDYTTDEDTLNERAEELLTAKAALKDAIKPGIYESLFQLFKFLYSLVEYLPGGPAYTL